MTQARAPAGIAPATRLAAGAQFSRDALETFTDFTAAYQPLLTDADAMDRLVTQLWTLHRRRRALRVWVGRHAGHLVGDDWLQQLDEVVVGWQRVREFAYVGLRRARHGRTVTAALLEDVRTVAAAEARIAHELQLPRSVAEGVPD